MPGRCDVGLDIVNVNRFRGSGSAGLEGTAIDVRMGLTDSDRTGIDTDGKVTEEGKVWFLMRDMKGVRVGKKRQVVPGRQSGEEFVGEKRSGVDGAIPDLAELFEGDGDAEPAGEMSMPLARRHAPFLPIMPAGVGLDDLQEFCRRMRAAACKMAQGTLDVGAHNDTANVENNGADGRRGHGYSVGALEARRARTAVIIAGRRERNTTARMTQWMRWLMFGTDRPRR